MIDLEVTGVHKSYGSQPVLRGLDLAVLAGSFTSILGPSGSGKTTLLRVIAGFERADRGVVRLAGAIVDDGDRHVAPDRRRIGFVPQDGSLFPHLSVEQNIGFGLRRSERRGKRVRELVEMAGLAGLERRYPHQLSGGQQQPRRPRSCSCHRTVARVVGRAVRLARRNPAGGTPPRRPARARKRRGRLRSSSPTTRTRRSRSPIVWR